MPQLESHAHGARRSHARSSGDASWFAEHTAARPHEGRLAELWLKARRSSGENASIAADARLSGRSGEKLIECSLCD
jgi:hypothetical protein